MNVELSEAGERLDELLDFVEQGHIVTITHLGKPIGYLSPVADRSDA